MHGIYTKLPCKLSLNHHNNLCENINKTLGKLVFVFVETEWEKFKILCKKKIVEIGAGV